MPHENVDLSLPPRLGTGTGVDAREGASRIARPPAGWNSWNPVGSPSSRRLRTLPPTVHSRQTLGSAHVCEWHAYTGSDDFDGCWA
jgi:hypothetical protein